MMAMDERAPTCKDDLMAPKCTNIHLYELQGAICAVSHIGFALMKVGTHLEERLFDQSQALTPSSRLFGGSFA